jgi:hypothetical protein
MNDDLFEYELQIPATSAKLSLSKQLVKQTLEKRTGRSISAEEWTNLWEEFRQSKNWFEVFPSESFKVGLRMYGHSDELLYNECFEKPVQEVIQSTFNNLWENLFAAALDAAEESILTKEEPITLENIESQTQKRIQDENVKNGLARCKRETKEKTIQKWKEWYFKKHVLISDVELPKGKTREDLETHIQQFFLEK